MQHTKANSISDWQLKSTRREMGARLSRSGQGRKSPKMLEVFSFPLRFIQSIIDKLRYIHLT